MEPKLILVGAGPGDPDLITLKAIKALKNAGIVLYDALVNTELLEYVPADVPRISVGKRSGKHSMLQQEINELIVRCAFSYGTVVRLKGGDPFVFGRGYEELEFAASYGIESEVVPGISSVQGVPASAGIPLTHRGASESFWVITGTTKNHELSQDLQHAARTSATILVLMGLKKLPEIAALYHRLDKAELPVAVIQNGTLDNEVIVRGQMNDIVEKVEAAGLTTPALIVIGEVAALEVSLQAAVRSYENAQLALVG